MTIISSAKGSPSAGAPVGSIRPASAPTGSASSAGATVRTRMCSFRQISRSRDPFRLSRLYSKTSGAFML